MLVALGGALGSVARYGVGGLTLRWLGSDWPFGTFAVNIIGGALIGALAGFLAVRWGADEERLRLLFQVGVLGGFTTFSAFSLETVMMIERRAYVSAASYTLGSVTLSVLAVFVGLTLARRILA